MRSRVAGRILCGLAAAIVLTQGSAFLAAARTSDDDAAAVKRMLVDWYASYAGTDEVHYRSFVTDDYVLLENGTIMGLEDDLKSMRNRPSGFARKDAFDFKSVHLHGDFAYATYFLESEIVDDTHVRQRKWLESAVLRRVDGRWRAALLHSTRMTSTDKPRR